MNGFLEQFNSFLETVNGVIWHEYVLYIVMGVGVLFTIWSVGCQYKALTHGTQVVRGKYDDKDDPGAINHFQALSAALSATVGLGNIGGVAVAIALGGPGAIFWMWMIGLVGMALKTTEVTLSMIYRNTEDPDNPHGGPMFVAAKGLRQMKEKGSHLGAVAGVVFAAVCLGAMYLGSVVAAGTPWAAWLPYVYGLFGVLALILLVLGFMNAAAVGSLIGGIFVITLLVSTITGGNMFQAWNVGVVTENALGVPTVLTGVILAVLVGAVIIGGIKRIGAVAGRLVPLMISIYLLSAIVVLIMNAGQIPEMLRLIVTKAFSTTEAEGAFVGGVWGFAFLWGLKRALFSSEAGQGSSPIAHSAAKTDEPVRESVVAGLEPFIDTIVVCTLTSLVILSTGAWNRGTEGQWETPPTFQAVQQDDGASAWALGAGVTPMPHRSDEALTIAQGRDWDPLGGESVFMLARIDEVQEDSGDNIVKIMGVTRQVEDDGLVVDWETVSSSTQPTLVDPGVYKEYPGAALTTHAFDRAIPGLGTWMILIASWLFAISTMISWSYYGENGIVFLFGDKAVLPYKFIYCLLAVVATAGFITTDAELDNLTALGTGVMLWANIPIMLIFGVVAMRAYHDYFRRMKHGEGRPPHEAGDIVDVIEGHDIEE